jgi:hypothetical protein
MRRVLSVLVMVVALIAPALTWEMSWMWSGSNAWMGAGLIVVSLLVGATISGLIAAGGTKDKREPAKERRPSGAETSGRLETASQRA